MRRHLSLMWRMLCTPTALAAAVGLFGSAAHVSAQGTSLVVEFQPSAEHSRTTSSGQALVTSYELLIYERGASSPYLRLNLGKPSPQSDGLVRVPFSNSVPVWPRVNTPSEARVVAIGPGGSSPSVPSGSFVYECNVNLSSSGVSAQAGGGSGTVSVSAPSQCGWAAVSTASWLSVTSGQSGTGNGTVAFTVAANTSGGSRVATLTIGGRVFTVTQPGTGGGSTSLETRYVSDMPTNVVSNGWGPPERNRSNGEQAGDDGRVITLNGRGYNRGLGVHANSDVRLALNGACSTFQSDIGVDDEVGDRGSVVFRVLGDGRELYNSGLMRGNTATRTVNVSVAGVNTLALVVEDGGDGIDYDHADWADARLQCTSGSGGGTPPPSSSPTMTTRYLSDLQWTDVTNGWGPVEKDRSNGEQGAADGRTMTMAGRTYAKGLGVHADSVIKYALNGACSRFQASVGIDDEVGDRGSVVFQVWGDGTLLFDSGRMTGATATRSVDVNLTGRRELILSVTPAGDGIDYDHANWAEARITCVQ